MDKIKDELQKLMELYCDAYRDDEVMSPSEQDALKLKYEIAWRAFMETIQPR